MKTVLQSAAIVLYSAGFVPTVFSKNNIEIFNPIKKIGDTEVSIYFKPTVYAKIIVKLNAVEEKK